jgi:hypothetical protein
MLPVFQLVIFLLRSVAFGENAAIKETGTN